MPQNEVAHLARINVFFQIALQYKKLFVVDLYIYTLKASPDFVSRVGFETALPIWLILFCYVRDCQDKVLMKENFRKIYRKIRKFECQKYNSCAICTEKK